MNDPAASPRPSQPEAASSVPPAGVLAVLAQMLSLDEDASLGRVLQRVADTARSTVPELSEVSVTMIEGGRPRTAVSAGRLAALLDERQYELGSGPCLDAAASGSTITVSTADPDNDYPEFSRVAARHGITQVLSIGLPVRDRRAAGLNMYTAHARRISADSVALATTLAEYAGVAVSNATLHQAALDEAHQLREAMKGRAVIEQAKGILMAAYRCSADEAFAVLVRASQDQNRKLRDIAGEIVSRS